jgi:hypothetical protein
LTEFLERCRRAGLPDGELDALPPAALYHFAEHKRIRAAAQTDAHYFRIAQCLRMSRRSLALAGMRLISVTPRSRLNDFFPSLPIDHALERLRGTVGDPRTEGVTGLYRERVCRQPPVHEAVRDVSPPRGWGASA